MDTDLDDSKDGFKWGKLLRTVRDEADEEIKHYSSFTLRGSVYHLNDDVHMLRGDQKMTKSDHDNSFWPARIESIWQNANHDRRILCRWYIRPADLPGLSTPEFCEYELFEVRLEWPQLHASLIGYLTTERTYG